MKEQITSVRNAIEGTLYRNVLKPILFRLDPERVHDRTLVLGKFLGSNAVTRGLMRAGFSYSNPMLEQKILGIKFRNPVGLSAGFDKDGHLTKILPSIGFGFEEIGSVSGEPCSGNPKPRLWRMPKERALVVNYGLKSEGCARVAERLRGSHFEIPIGTNVVKTNSPETVDTEKGIEDYVKAYRAFAHIGAYTTINLSCPNAFGGQPFHSPQKLESLLREIRKVKTKKPLFLKIAPDLSEKELDGIIRVASKFKVDGFVCTNLTKDREKIKIPGKNIPGKGGISGKLVEELSNRTISYIYKKTKEKFIIIGVGGIFTAEDAYKKIKCGASLIQLITGLVFQGPQVVGEINQGLVHLLERDGYKNISQAVGDEWR